MGKKEEIIIFTIFNASSPVAQMVKRLPTKQETWVQSLGQEISWRRKWQSTPVFLPGKSHGQRNLVGYSPWGRKEDTTSLSLFNGSQQWLSLVDNIAQKRHNQTFVSPEGRTPHHRWGILINKKLNLNLIRPLALTSLSRKYREWGTLLTQHGM